MNMHAAPAKTLKIRALNKFYSLSKGRRVHAIRDFSLRLAPGEFVTLLGPSGCGKTSVLRTLAGLEEFDDGEILLDDRSIARLPPHRRRIGLVFQNYALFPHMSVFENVAYSLRIRRAPESEVRSTVTSVLEAVGLDELAPRLPGQLSGGQQQRVAVARALVMKPDLLLFDEPLSNLDAKLRVQVRAELRRLQRRFGTTALYVTHDQDEAMSLSDRIAVMRSGTIEQVGSPEDIYTRPANLFVADFVGKINALSGVVVRTTDDLTTVKTLNASIRIPAGRVVARDMTLLVRPEAVRLVAPSAGDMSGRVEEIEYLGDRIEYRICVEGTQLIASEPALGRRMRIAEGEIIGIDLIEDAIHLLPLDAHPAVKEPSQE